MTHRERDLVNHASREARQRLVRLLLLEKAYEPALALLRRAVAESPEDVEAQLRLGLIFGELKEYQKAADQMKVVLTLRPQELRVRDHLAYLYEELKENDKAIADLKGKTFCFVDPNSTSGYLVPSAFFLMEMGVDPKKLDPLAL